MRSDPGGSGGGRSRSPALRWSGIEAGKRSVSTLELSKLADLYHRPVTYFLEPGEAVVEVGGAKSSCTGCPRAGRMTRWSRRRWPGARRFAASAPSWRRSSARGPTPTRRFTTCRLLVGLKRPSNRGASSRKRRGDGWDWALPPSRTSRTSSRRRASGPPVSGLPNEMSGLFHPDVFEADGHPDPHRASAGPEAVLVCPRVCPTPSSTGNTGAIVSTNGNLAGPRRERRANAFAAAFLMPRGGRPLVPRLPRQGGCGPAAVLTSTTIGSRPRRRGRHAERPFQPRVRNASATKTCPCSPCTSARAMSPQVYRLRDLQGF